MILSDGTILTIGQLIKPFDFDQLQPASYDLKLGLIKDNYARYDIAPKQFILASTYETINMPNDLVGRLEGKSSWARKGLIIHTAGFVDPGFHGELVLEITNLSDKIITLEYGTLIAQICFEQLDIPAVRPYGHPALNSHYQGQKGVVESWMDHSNNTIVGRKDWRCSGCGTHNSTIFKEPPVCWKCGIPQIAPANINE